MPIREPHRVENRLSQRKLVSWRARLLRENRTIVECRAVDSSVSGLGLICQVPMTVGEVLQIAIQIPDERNGPPRVVVEEGRVAASILTPAGYRIGISLIDPLQELLDAVPSGVDETA